MLCHPVKANLRKLYLCFVVQSNVLLVVLQSAPPGCMAALLQQPKERKGNTD